MNTLKFNTQVIKNTCISGAGGKEKEIIKFFSSDHVVERKNHPIYDFIIDKQVLVEVKKQTSGNWFDYAKYHDLSKESEQIVMLFVIHNKGKTTCIFGISLKDFLDILCKDPVCIADGWSYQEFKDAHYKKSLYKKLEYKAFVNVTRFIKLYRDECFVYFEN